MSSLTFAPSFIRQYKKLEISLQEEVLEKIELFKHDSNHKLLKVHKLHGEMSNCYSFSVNYAYRIVFSYNKNREISLLSIGSHDIYI